MGRKLALRTSAQRVALRFLLLALGAGCSEAPGPSWIPLAARLELAPRPERALLAWRGRELELVSQASGASLRIPILRADWTWAESYRAWGAQLGLNPPRAFWQSLRLESAQVQIPRLSPADLLEEPRPAGFTIFSGALVLGGTGEPPAEATLCFQISGPARGAERRVGGGNFSGLGVEVLTGARASAVVDLPPASTLRFGTGLEALLAPEERDESLFRVRLDGAIVFEQRQRAGEHPLFAWHSVALPARGRAGARLDFEVEGPPASTVFLDPLVAPLEIGRRGARPWADARPDIVVVLADTFRADNLAAYGGEAGVAPNLDELAARGLCFTRAWSSATWTLPAHASLFSGLYPPQVGVSGQNRRMSAKATSVAEMLAHAGYRTGAVTDGGFVSARFGLDQGFGFFSESGRELEDMLGEAERFLDADDGRPLFLFVHTYRVHWPYRVSERTRAELGERLGIRGEASALLEAALREARDQGVPAATRAADLHGFRTTPRMRELARAMHAHYLGGVADLDRALAGFLAHLGRSGLLDAGYLVFTSDHGESFAEHGSLFHGQRPFEEQTRVPLLILGRALAARRIDAPVSLIDLAPTLADMADVAANPDWPGRALLAPFEERALFSFEAGGKPGDALFVLAAKRKVLLVPDGRGTGDGELVGAFELDEDPREERDAGANASWPRELLARHAARLAASVTPILPAESTELDEATAKELRELGY